VVDENEEKSEIEDGDIREEGNMDDDWPTRALDHSYSIKQFTGPSAAGKFKSYEFLRKRNFDGQLRYSTVNFNILKLLRSLLDKVIIQSALFDAMGLGRTNSNLYLHGRGSQQVVISVETPIRAFLDLYDIKEVRTMLDRPSVDASSMTKSEVKNLSVAFLEELEKVKKKKK
jgi:hypothetical protein